ncbi:MAG: hypothetical protein VB039_10295 [Oscillospiraceae bacterium]|nr:hypothetical protein [Oscillospiraceae bacterium]
MEYPILISGEAAGVLNTRRDGLYTVFEASLPPQPRLTRLWLTGADGAFCLGLMEPGAGGVQLRRRMSRAELRALPREVSAAQALPAEAGAPATGRETPPEPPRAAEERGEAEAESEKDTLAWRVNADGSMSVTDGGLTLLALPCALRRRTPGLRLALVDGREYMVFIY